jgi:hypothetical protein
MGENSIRILYILDNYPFVPVLTIDCSYGRELLMDEHSANLGAKKCKILPSGNFQMVVNKTKG